MDINKFLEFFRDPKNIPLTLLLAITIAPIILSVPWIKEIIELDKFSEEYPFVLPGLKILAIFTFLLLFFNIIAMCIYQIKYYVNQRRHRKAEIIRLDNLRKELYIDEEVRKNRSIEAAKNKIIQEEQERLRKREEFIQKIINITNPSKKLLIYIVEEYNRGDIMTITYSSDQRRYSEELSKSGVLKREQYRQGHNILYACHVIPDVYDLLTQNNKEILNIIKNSIPD